MSFEKPNMSPAPENEPKRPSLEIPGPEQSFKAQESLDRIVDEIKAYAQARGAEVPEGSIDDLDELIFNAKSALRTPGGPDIEVARKDIQTVEHAAAILLNKIDGVE